MGLENVESICYEEYTWSWESECLRIEASSFILLEYARVLCDLPGHVMNIDEALATSSLELKAFTMFYGQGRTSVPDGQVDC